MGLIVGRGIIKEFDIKVGRDLLLRRLRVRPGALEQGARIEQLLEEAVDKGYLLIAPAAVYGTMDIARCERSRVLFRDTEFRIESAGVAELLRPSRKATLMAATIGNKLSLETERLMKEKKMTEALLMDAFGSEAVEEVVNTLCRLLQEAEVFKDQTMTRRSSPGYGDWRLEAQEAIVKELAVDRIGITLSRHFALVPEKSITAIVGWNKE